MRRRAAIAAWVVVSLAIIGIGGYMVHDLRRAVPEPRGAWQQTPPSASASLRPTAPTLAKASADGSPRFITGIGPNRRYFVDQDGVPILVRGDAPWSLLVDLQPEEARRYLSTRSEQGFNAAVVSLVGTTANGGPSDDGATADGLLPFVDGDVLRWQRPYFDRAHEILAQAASLGITVLLYPIDSWTLEQEFADASPETCREYGAQAARWAADLPNVLWMSGGDYRPSARGDACIDAAMAGIRSTGDERLFSIQLWDVTSAAVDDVWRDRVDWNFAYSYAPTPLAVRAAYDSVPARPALLGEANYEGENNQGGPETTTETLRRQTLWAITSGAAGDVFGTDDWEFLDGWQGRLASQGAMQVSRIRDYVASLPWWTLVPDDRLVRGDVGSASQDQDVLESDLVTAALSPDGTLGLVYVPTARTLSLDVARLAPGSTGAWVDPSTGTATPVTLAPELSTPGVNAAGAGDWLLVLGTAWH